MFSFFDILNLMDEYYATLTDSDTVSSLKSYYGKKMIEMVNNYPELEGYWKYDEMPYCWRDRFTKIKTISETEKKQFKKMPIQPTFYIYFAHHWDFDKSYSWKTVKEMREYYTSMGRDADEIKKKCKQYLEAKIGMSATLEQRNGQLYNDEGLQIKKYFSFRGTYSQALYLESTIRLYVEQHYGSFNCEHFGNDHFHCRNTNIIKSIEKNFLSVCEQGYATAQNLR